MVPSFLSIFDQEYWKLIPGPFLGVRPIGQTMVYVTISTKFEAGRIRKHQKSNNIGRNERSKPG
jgi:hypothetical protein